MKYAASFGYGFVPVFLVLLLIGLVYGVNPWASGAILAAFVGGAAAVVFRVISDACPVGTAWRRPARAACLLGLVAAGAACVASIATAQIVGGEPQSAIASLIDTGTSGDLDVSPADQIWPGVFAYFVGRALSNGLVAWVLLVAVIAFVDVKTARLQAALTKGRSPLVSGLVAYAKVVSYIVSTLLLITALVPGLVAVAAGRPSPELGQNWVLMWLFCIGQFITSGAIVTTFITVFAWKQSVDKRDRLQVERSSTSVLSQQARTVLTTVAVVFSCAWGLSALGAACVGQLSLADQFSRTLANFMLLVSPVSTPATAAAIVVLLVILAWKNNSAILWIGVMTELVLGYFALRDLYFGISEDGAVRILVSSVYHGILSTMDGPQTVIAGMTSLVGYALVGVFKGVVGVLVIIAGIWFVRSLLEGPDATAEVTDRYGNKSTVDIYLKK